MLRCAPHATLPSSPHATLSAPHRTPPHLPTLSAPRERAGARTATLCTTTLPMAPSPWQAHQAHPATPTPQANQVLLPCGHVCVCANCVSSIQQQCPLCREPCTSTHTIYT